MTFDILIILNNFMHDLAAAMWFCGTIVLFITLKSYGHEGGEGIKPYAKKLFYKIKKITNASLIIVLLGGIIRAVNYSRYEWLPALGRDQVILLIIKHVLLIGIVIAGIFLQIHLTRRVKSL
jgi:uncharacterized membrane protein